MWWLLLGIGGIGVLGVVGYSPASTQSPLPNSPLGAAWRGNPAPLWTRHFDCILTSRHSTQHHGGPSCAAACRSNASAHRRPWPAPVTAICGITHRSVLCHWRWPISTPEVCKKYIHHVKGCWQSLRVQVNSTGSRLLDSKQRPAVLKGGNIFYHTINILIIGLVVADAEGSRLRL